MKAITRAVTLEHVADLADAPPRAYLAFVLDGAPGALRVACRRDGERWFIALPDGATIPNGAPVVLLIDDGDLYFDLRGLRVSGVLAPARGHGRGERELAADKTIAWHYGSMRRKS
jgi:hypothetical protein